MLMRKPTKKKLSVNESDDIDQKSSKLFCSVKSTNMRKRSGVFRRLPGGGRKQDDWWIALKLS